MENALMLVICQEPEDPGVKWSGALSFTNDDPSVNMLRESFKYLDLDRGITVPWNAILWTQMGEKDPQRVRDWHIIPDHLDYLPNLNVAVLLGSSYAWQLEGEIESHRPGVKILKGPHPSPRVS
jgi:hypothetical protein